MADHREERISAPGRLRRVTPEENRRLVLSSLREGRCDTGRQAGWDLCREEEVAPLEAQLRSANEENEEAREIIRDLRGSERHSGMASTLRSGHWRHQCCLRCDVEERADRFLASPQEEQERDE